MNVLFLQKVRRNDKQLVLYLADRLQHHNNQNTGNLHYMSNFPVFQKRYNLLLLHHTTKLHLE